MFRRLVRATASSVALSFAKHRELAVRKRCSNESTDGGDFGCACRPAVPFLERAGPRRWPSAGLGQLRLAGIGPVIDIADEKQRRHLLFFSAIICEICVWFLIQTQITRIIAD